VTAAGAQSASDAGRRNGTDGSGRIVVNGQQQGSLSTAIHQRNIQPVTNLNFSVAVGTLVPNSVKLVPVSDDIVAVLPQFRNYSFFVDERQELVIVDPATKEIAALVPISGGPTAGPGSRAETVGVGQRTDTESSKGPVSSRSAPPPLARKKVTREVAPSDDAAGEVTKRTFTQTERERNTIRGGTERRKPARTDTDVTVGRSVPDTVQIEELPPVAHRGAPAVRYRYRRVEPEGSVQSGPVDHGPFGIFDIFR
jgi:hypothetical protein